MFFPTSPSPRRPLIRRAILTTSLTPPALKTRRSASPLTALACAGVLALGAGAHAGTFTWFNGTGNWNSTGNWAEIAIPPLSDPTTQLVFGGTGATPYTSTNDLGAVQLNILTLNSTATATNTIAANSGNSLNFISSGATTPTLVQNGTGAFNISSPLTLTNNGTLKLGATAIKGGLITISGAITPVGTSTFRVENTTSATATANSIMQVALTGTNGFTGTTPIVVNTGVTVSGVSTGMGARTVLSLNSPFAAGNSSVNANLAPITLWVNNNIVRPASLPNNETAGRVIIEGTATDWSSILQIGATIGAAPNAAGITVNGVTYGTGGGQTPMDFSYQITNSNTPTGGQIRLSGAAGASETPNVTAGVGFAALGAGTGTANNRVVGLFATGSTTTLAVLVNRGNYGHGNMDHLTFGSPSANGSLIFLNDINPGNGTGANPRGFETIRGVGNVPEGILAGRLAITGTPIIIFDGNGGMVFSNPLGSGTPGSGPIAPAITPSYSYLLRSGAVYVGANDLGGANGALGGNTATFSLGSANTNANLAFMTYGAGAGVGGSATITSARPVTVGNFTHGSVTLGGFTNDYTAFTGPITLNNAVTPTTFIAGNGVGSNGTTPSTGGRVDFSGVISGASSVVVGPATVEGENLTAAPSGMAGISLTQSGMVVFNNSANSYAGSTTISSGILSTGTAGTLANGGAPSSIGQSDNTAASLVLDGGGTLRYASSGAAASTDRLFTLGAGGGGIEASGANPLTFAGNGANLLTYSGSGARTFTLGGTNTGANTFAPTISDGTGGATSLTKAGAGSWVLTGANDYTGPTAVNGGSLTVSAATPLNSTVITVANTATLVTQTGAGKTIGTTGTTLNVSAGGALSLADGVVGTLNLNTTGAGAGTILTLGGTTATPSLLTFDVGSAGADALVVNRGIATFAGTPQNNIALAAFGATAPSTLTGIPLISVPNGTLSLSNFSLQTTAVSFGSSSYIGNLAISGGNQLVLNLTAASLSYYWKGTTNNSWGVAANFATDPSGAVSQIATPGAQNNVFMTADSAANLTTALNGSRTINSLSFTGTGTAADSTPVTIGAGSGGSLTLNALNSFSDVAANNYAAGTGLVVQAGSAAHTISANVVLAGSQTWQIDNSASNALTVSGVVSGAASSLTKTGPGKLILSNTNTYGGLTTVSNGTLQIGDGATGSVVGAIQLGGSGTLALNLPAATTFTNVLSGSGNLSVDGPGTTILSAASTFSGTTVVTSGTLELGDALALQNSLLNYDNQGGTVSFGVLTAATLGGLSGAQDLALTNAAVSDVALTLSSKDATYSGVLSGTGSVIKTGSGTTQTFAGANTYTGPTTLNSGTLKAAVASVTGVSGAFGLNSAVTIGNATLDITGFDTEIGSLSGGGQVIIDLATLTVGTNNTSPTPYTGIISGSGILKKTGTGTLTLSGVNTYTGGTAITGGTVLVSAAENLGAVPTAFANDNIVLDGGTLLSTAGVALANRGITLLAGGGGLGSNGNRLTLAATTIISGAGALTVAGTNQLVIQSQNTYTGGTILQLGGQTLVSSTSVGPADSPTSGPFGTGGVNFAGGTIRAGTDANHTVGNPISINANTTFVSFGASADRDLTFTGTTTLTGSRTLTVNTSPTAGSTGIFFNGEITDGGNNYTLTKTGNGTLSLGGAQNYGTLTTSAGTTNVNGSFTGGTATVNANATTNFSASQTLASLVIGNGAVVTLTASAAPAPAPSFAAPPEVEGGLVTAPVPEPATCSLLMLGALGLAARRRRESR